MDEPLRAHTLSEVEYFLRVTPCGKCAHGPLEVRDIHPEGQGEGPAGRGARVRATCRRCGAQATFHFAWDGPVPEGAETINPTDEPSRLVDLAQWVGLCYALQDQAEKASDPAEARLAQRRAALCLAEALKFHGEEELPPESAFFTEASLAGFRKNPALYARTRLRELQALLPAAPTSPQEVASGRRHPWWKFWEK